MRNPRLTVTLAGIAALLTAAFVVAGVALAATKPTKADMLAGKKIFASAGCGKCHTLTAAKAHGTVGPNLNTVKPALGAIVTQVTDGGRFMPPFGAAQGGSLSPTKVKQVAAFVYGAEHHLIS
jgi:mono/diheme cytochrome c family protein